MSEIRATTISDAAGTGPITLTGQSAAKAWVNFYGTGTAVINDSLNASSLYDNATGQFLVNFSSSFANTSYSVTSGQGNTIGGFNTGYDSVTPYDASAHIFSKYDVVNSIFQDPQYTQAQCIGDLA